MLDCGSGVSSGSGVVGSSVDGSVWTTRFGTACWKVLGVVAGVLALARGSSPHAANESAMAAIDTVRDIGVIRRFIFSPEQFDSEISQVIMSDIPIPVNAKLRPYSVADRLEEKG